MKNEYEIRGDVTAIVINSPKYGRMETLISTSKLDRAKEFPKNWNAMWQEDIKSFYVKGDTVTCDGKRTTIRLHRWITDASKGMEVDHKNHNALDNTDDNLRVCTSAENQQNKKGAYANNKSGIRGVCWKKDNKKWLAHFQINGVKKHIGLFTNIEDAEQAVIEARMKHMPYSQESI